MEEDVCRICRGEQTPEDPLYHPCRCAGSIKYVHRECLLEWLQHARTASKCELCGARYKLVQRYKKSMPSHLYIRDYALYGAKSFVEALPLLFICVRGFVLVSCLAILAKYALEFSTISSDRVFYPRMMSSSWEILRARCAQNPPRGSGAPIIDWLLSFAIPASELRSAWVDGIVLLLLFLFFFVMLWIVTMWVLNEPAVVHDLEHIGLGEISHMDNGDDDMVEFDEINNGNAYAIEAVRNLPMHRDRPPAAHHARQGDFILSHNHSPNSIDNLSANGEAGSHHEVLMRDGHPLNDAMARDPQADAHQGRGEVRHGLFEVHPGAPAHAPLNLEQQANPGNGVADANPRNVRDMDEDQDLDVFHDANEEHRAAFQRDIAVAEQEEDAEDLEALGFAIRGLIFEIFGGTNLEALGEFGVVAFATLALVEFVYMIPFIIIRINWLLMSSLIARLALSLNMPDIATLASKLGSVEVESLMSHFVLLVAHFAILVVFLRYLELRSMKFLLKRSWGVSLVMGLYQFYAVLKSLLMMMIEFFAFPQFCGSLIHLVSVPLTPSLADHWLVCKQHPFLVLFGHWFAGFLYMHGIMTFVNTCRKFFRKGVLYFVHDGEAPDFIRAIVFVSVPKQIYRIGISAGLYGLFILTGIGSVTLTLSKVLPALNVSYWPGLDLLRMWPLFIFGHLHFVTLRGSKVQLYDVLHTFLREEVWLYVLRYAGNKLDLQSWLFGKRRVLSEKESQALSKKDTSLGVFVRAPRSSRFRDRKNLRLFIPVDQRDERLEEAVSSSTHTAESNKSPVELSRYIVVWRPRLFWVRIGLFAFIVWGAATGLTLLLTIIPWGLGRLLDQFVYGYTIQNDLILYGAGLSLCLPCYANLIRKYPPPEMLHNSKFSTLEGEIPVPSVRTSTLSFIWSLLLLGMQIASPESWSHWYVIWPPSSWTTIPTLTLTCLASLCAKEWLGAIAASDIMIFQQFLETIRSVPPTRWYFWAVVEPLLLWRLWIRWSQSQRAQEWSNNVRNFMYLDGTEVKNYDE